MKDHPMLTGRPPAATSKEKKYRKKYLPIWYDPQIDAGHVLLSWYIPILWPETPQDGEEQVRVNAIELGKAVLPKAMFKEEVEAFLETEEGYEWYNQQIEAGQILFKARARKCSKCCCVILPRVQAKKYVAECPQCHRFADFVRM